MLEDLERQVVIERLAMHYGLPKDGVAVVLDALEQGGGAMAQFSHPAFGGMSQWSPGMIMIGDMFNQGMKARVDGLCTDLSDYLRLRSHGAAPSSRAAHWWPEELGEASAAGGQNGVRYAAFGEARRLLIDRGGEIAVYDTGDHRISGVAQEQGASREPTFTSQHGLVDVATLRRL